MPPASDHLIQAQHNRRLLAAMWANRPLRSNWLERLVEAFRPPTELYPDWAVTVAFYVAVHRVEAYYDRKFKPHSSSHGERDRTFASLSELRLAYGHYFELKNLSIASRYKCLPAKWTPTEVQRALYLLNNVERHLNSLP